MTWDLSCRDWEERLRGGRSLVPASLPLDHAAAAKLVEIFDELKLPDVEGHPPLRDAVGDWFRDIVRICGGSFIDAERMVREFFVLVPKKNGKTTDAAALMLSSALSSKRPRAEFLYVGATQAVADLGFGQTIGMIEADNELNALLHVQEHKKIITVREDGQKLMVKTFDEDILTGVKPSGGILVDELHLLGKVAKAAAVLRQIRGGMIPYPESFLFFITTQSEEQPAGVFRAELMKARAIRDGRRQAKMLPVLYEFPERVLKTDAWRNREIWHQVNPSVGRSITVARLAEDYEDALTKTEKDVRGWASQHLNVEIGIALKSDAWEGVEYWEAQADASLTLEEIIARCDVCVVGIDGGGLDDLLGLHVIGRERETRDWLLFVHAWAHKDVLNRRKDIAPKLLDFVDEGTLTIYEKPGEDVAAVADIVCRLEDAGLLPEERAIGVDPVGITEIVDELVARKFTVEEEGKAGKVVGIQQGWTLSNTIKTVARRLAAGTAFHAGTRLMNWVMGNIKIEPRGNAVTVNKQTSGSAKIDPFLALCSAAALMVKNPEAAGTSIYDQLAREEAAKPKAALPAKADPIAAYEKARESYAQRFLAGDDD